MVPIRFLALHFNVDVGHSILMLMFATYFANALEPLDRELFDWISEIRING
jgi:hypothetical protein